MPAGQRIFVRLVVRSGERMLDDLAVVLSQLLRFELVGEGVDIAGEAERQLVVVVHWRAVSIPTSKVSSMDMRINALFVVPISLGLLRWRDLVGNGWKLARASVLQWDPAPALLWAPVRPLTQAPP